MLYGQPCGSEEDYFFFSPWRRPGSAPVIDSCGTAGGRVPGQGSGGFGATFTNTTHAKVGAWCALERCRRPQSLHAAGRPGVSAAAHAVGRDVEGRRHRRGGVDAAGQPWGRLLVQVSAQRVRSTLA